MNPIKIGFPVSVTGRYSVQGKESLQGLLLWHSRIISQNGIFIPRDNSSSKVELKYYDDQSNESKCIEVTRDLIVADKVDLLLGPYSSGLSMAIAPLTKQYNKIVWNYGGATDEITESGFSNFINAISPSSKYFCGIIDIFNKKLSDDTKKIALVFAQDSGFSTKVKDGAKKHALNNNFEVFEFGYNSGIIDFSDIVERVYKLSPDLILGVGRTEDDINFAKSIIGAGKIDKGKVGLVAASINYFKEILGDACEGFLSTSQWEKDIDIEPDFGPAPAEFFHDYCKEYGIEPNYLAAQAYNIGLIIEKCLSVYGSINEIELYKTARNLDFKTFYGRFKIDKQTGIQCGHSMLVTQWITGSKVVINQT